MKKNSESVSKRVSEPFGQLRAGGRWRMINGHWSIRSAQTYKRTHLDLLYSTENERKFDQMRHFLKAIAELQIKKVTKYG